MNHCYIIFWFDPVLYIRTRTPRSQMKYQIFQKPKQKEKERKKKNRTDKINKKEK